MATSTVAGLFGSPLSETDLQNQLIEQRAADFAKKDLNEKLSQMAYKSGAGLGQGLASAFGVDIVDPAVRRASQIRSLASQFDTNTPEGLKQFAGALKNIDPEIAAKAAQLATDLEKEQATVFKTKAEGMKALRENAAADPLQQLIRTGKYTPESVAAYKDSGDIKDLVAQSPNDPTQVVETTKGMLLVNKITGQEIANLGMPTQKGTKVDVHAPDVGKIVEAVGSEALKKNWVEAGKAYTLNKQILPKLAEVEKNLPNTLTGSFSDTALGVGKALSAFGIPVDQRQLSNTEYMNSVTSQLVQTIARNFPGSQSNQELQQLLKSKPSATQQVQTIARILRDLNTEIQSNTLTYEKLSKLPLGDRYQTDFTAEQGKTFEKLSRYRALERQARQATTANPMNKSEVEEAKKLKEDLGL